MVQVPVEVGTMIIAYLFQFGEHTVSSIKVTCGIIFQPVVYFWSFFEVTNYIHFVRPIYIIVNEPELEIKVYPPVW